VNAKKNDRFPAMKIVVTGTRGIPGIMGGVGFNIRKFFFDFRLSGYARSHVWNTFVSDGVSQRVRVPRNLVYGGWSGSSSEQKTRVRRRTLFLHNK